MLEVLTMRVSLSLDPNLVQEAVRISKARSKREAIEMALKEFIRRRRLEKAIARGGQVALTFSAKELVRRRAEG
jgi:Arc/MetJ family transcription regulator